MSQSFMVLPGGLRVMADDIKSIALCLGNKPRVIVAHGKSHSILYVRDDDTARQLSGFIHDLLLRARAEDQKPPCNPPPPHLDIHDTDT